MNFQKPTAALNTLIVALAVAGFGTLAVGAFVGLPLLALAVLLGVTKRCRLARSLRREGAHTRRTRAIVVAASIAIFASGRFINALPSEDVHDRYWALFVAPLMIAFIVGVVAIPMLVWTYLPRRHEPDGGSSAKL